MPRPKEVSHPFLNTTYSLYRLSPLFKFPTLDPSEHSSLIEQLPKQRNQSPFKAHERAVTNLLKGEVLRGVNVTRGDASVDGENGEMGKLGRFKGCKWRLVPTLAALREYNVEQASRDDDDEEEEDMEEVWVKAIREIGDVAGVEVSFDYERGVGGYVAYLTGPPQKEDGEFTKLPLVLTRLPKVLLDVLFEYLAATFDTLALPMRSGVGWLGEMLEMYVEQTKGWVDKGIALTYRIPTGLGGGVKVITVGLEKGDISGFLNYGSALEPRRKGPFLLAVEKHMESTMGLGVGKLVLAKVTCGGFIVGGAPSGTAVAKGNAAEATEPSGRVKIFVPRKGQIEGVDESGDPGDVDGGNIEEAAVEKFMDELIQLAIRKGGYCNA
ncbi:kinetochore complex Sim4 subunit Fta1-domain-containing protein [Tirmania nivea]|nr:kinetochore complex Sim4 subunit Fta1-domain-containing protein [Tirmania nivea]